MVLHEEVLTRCSRGVKTVRRWWNDGETLFLQGKQSVSTFPVC